ncbi:MgtC/SapB family protein [Enterococcus faecalis]
MEHVRLTIVEIIVRLSLAMVIGGVIGYERQYKNRPAGLRTHILVCMGATIIALIQDQIAFEALRDAINNPDLTGVVRSDQARLIAQVVSGIGFLGAGTIIVTKQSVTGLTTAASLWAVAGLGIATGMGYYAIAITSFVGVFFALTLVKKIIRVPSTKKLEIRYIHKKETKEFINDYFEKRNIEIYDVNFDVTLNEDIRIYKNVYTIDLPPKLTYAEVIEELSAHKNVTNIHLVNLAS